MSVIAVTGLAREARIARRAGVVPVVGAGDEALLARRLQEAIAAGGKAIISFGIAGALAPLLKAGDAIVATHVVHGKERYATDERWTAALRKALPSVRPAIIVGHGEIVSNIDGKKRLFAMSGAHAVDMESHIAARIAKSHGLPFVALRTISDPATRGLPQAALTPLKSNGGVNLLGVLGSVAAEPSQIFDLMTTGRESGKAFRALLVSRRRLGAGLGCPYLG
jgi:hopanoid-associated phosphorylase